MAWSRRCHVEEPPSEDGLPERKERLRVNQIKIAVWLVRHLIDAIFGHSLGPGVSTRADRAGLYPLVSFSIFDYSSLIVAGLY